MPGWNSLKNSVILSGEWIKHRHCGILSSHIKKDDFLFKGIKF